MHSLSPYMQQIYRAHVLATYIIRRGCKFGGYMLSMLFVLLSEESNLLEIEKED